MTKLLNKIKENKIQFLGSVGVCATMVTSVAHADSDMTTMTTAITTALTSGKTDVIACLAAVVGIGAGIYLVKFGARQGLNFFSMIANKK